LAQLFTGKVEFVLPSSVQIQRTQNPPGNPKSRYMTSTEMPVKAEDWQENSTKHTDSWWLHWQAWQAERSGKLKKTPTSLGNKTYPAGEAAPGTYVHER